MSTYIDSYLIVGTEFDKAKLVDKALKHMFTEDVNFLKRYETQKKVVELMPKYQADLDMMIDIVLDEYIYDHLYSNGIHVTTDEQGSKYIGIQLKQVTDIDKLNQDWLDNTKNLADKFTTLTGLQAQMIATHGVH